MLITELRARLDEHLVLARTDAAESHKAAHNSYGAGYDRGFADALQIVLNTINGKDENILLGG